MLPMDLRERRAAAARVRARREAIGWSQADLAKHATVSLGTIGNIEGGVITPQTSKLERVLAALAYGEAAASDGVDQRMHLTNEDGEVFEVDTQLELLAAMTELRIRRRPDLLRDYIDVLVDISDRSRVEEAQFRIAAFGLPRAVVEGYPVPDGMDAFIESDQGFTLLAADEGLGEQQRGGEGSTGSA